MKCYYHPDREAVGQCENNEHKVFLCPECCAQRINGLCPKCAETKHYTDALKRRLSAQIDIIMFAITAVIGAIWGASLYISGQLPDFFNGLFHTYLLGWNFDALLPILEDLRALNGLFVLLVLTYIIAATFLGAKFILVTAWKLLGLGGLIILGFLGLTTIILYFPIVMITVIIGVVITPFLLFGAYRTLCQPAPVKTAGR